MKITLITLLAVFLCGGLFAEEVSISVNGTTMSIEINDVQSDGTTTTGSVIEAIADKLDLLEQEYISQLKRLEQERAKRLITEIFALLVQLPDNQAITLNTSSSSSQSTSVTMDVSVSGWETMDAEMDEPELEQAPLAMNGSDFGKLKRNVQSEDFSDDMMGVIEVAVLHHYFSVDQIGQLVQLFDFGDEQVAVVRLLWPRVVDPENGHDLLSLFTYSNEKDAVKGIINQ
ncbi:MAG: DUF4476 domain-containing protein [Candidatus Cloacimonetes bacterium]|nr:DUF4476 domain-containing protein [Candidatus Cloacimonadota bacterium]